MASLSRIRIIADRSRSSASAMRSISSTPVLASRTVTATRSCVFMYDIVSRLLTRAYSGSVVAKASKVMPLVYVGVILSILCGACAFLTIEKVDWW